MRWNIRENVLLIHITSSFIKANIQWWVWWHKTDSFKCMHLTLSQVHQPAQWPDPSTLDKIISNQTLKSCVSQNKPINYSARKSSTPCPKSFSQQLSSTHLVSAPELRWTKRNHRELQGYQSWDCWDQNLPAPPWSPCTSEELHLQLKDGDRPIVLWGKGFRITSSKFKP